MTRRTSLVCAGAWALAAQGAAAQGAAARSVPPPPEALRGARQLVLVTARGWDDTVAVLRRYARATARAPWQAVGDSVPVVLGRSGLAWGVGQGSIPEPDVVSKREGDGRSPAGAFGLLHTFGYAGGGAAAEGGFTARASVEGAGRARLPHVAVAPGTVCVDDPGSRLYNVVADSAAAAEARWGSAERMRDVAGYRVGVAVAYNGARTRSGGVGLVAPGPAAVPGRGSCIFLHVWDSPTRPTAGCTAMTAPNLATIVAWLDPRARPVLVQLPAGALARLQHAWTLPGALPPPRRGA